MNGAFSSKRAYQMMFFFFITILFIFHSSEANTEHSHLIPRLKFRHTQNNDQAMGFVQNQNE